MDNKPADPAGAVQRPAGENWLSLDAGDCLPAIGHTVLCFYRDAPAYGLWERRNNEAWEWANISHWLPLPGRPAALATKPAETPTITERELAFALNYHSDDSRINDADWKIARRYFEVIERNRGTHPSLHEPKGSERGAVQPPAPEPQWPKKRDLAASLRISQQRYEIDLMWNNAIDLCRRAAAQRGAALTDEIEWLSDPGKK